eukprot:TRINITY_DN9346_c0_g1_i1.p1 TRINITY_DN9346_c0_g1~~TRINITY_DN9346_c0_g1_i1.p1  ORF type:complete len:283 (-),score=47.64 TRINITY_DN9346_c0_g1_i1:358-1206(-)
MCIRDRYQRRVRGNPSAGMGRAAIGTAFREDKTARKVTLSKRKKGIYKKCQELSSLCGVEISIICVGDYCKPSAYVATPDGPQEDLASTYRVVQRFSDAIGAQMPMSSGVAPSDSQEVENLRMRCRAMEDELQQLRTLVQISGGAGQPVAVMQNYPPAMGEGLPVNTTLDHVGADQLAEDMVMRLSGRMSGMNISFGGLDTMSSLEGDLRMSLDADVRRVSKDLASENGSEPDTLGECQKITGAGFLVKPEPQQQQQAPPGNPRRSTEELLAAFVNDIGGEL